MSQITRPQMSRFKRASLLLKRIPSTAHIIGKMEMREMRPLSVKIGDKIAPPAAGVLYLLCGFAPLATIFLTAIGYAAFLGLSASVGYVKGACAGARLETVMAKRGGLFSFTPK